MSTQVSLTRSQLSQLVEEYKDLRDWTIVRDFCIQAYGEGKVDKFIIETHGEYNDEGGTDYDVESIYAESAEADEVEFDLTLPFWLEILKDVDSTEGRNDPESIQEAALEALRDYWRPRDEASQWVYWEELPCDVHEGGSTSYDLTGPPHVHFSVLVEN